MEKCAMNITTAKKIIVRYKKVRKEISAIESKMWKGSLNPEFRQPLKDERNNLLDELKNMRLKYRKAVTMFI
jgi:hypothetical protein